MIIITGGAGFIGSAMVWKLNQLGYQDIMIVDRLGTSKKWLNLRSLKWREYRHKTEFLQLIKEDKVKGNIEAVIHLGACSATTELDMDFLVENNLNYSKSLLSWAREKCARFIYASSAATYGDGSNSFDDQKSIDKLEPINRYGYSKHLFDVWVKEQKLSDSVVGLKFFNVYGPNEVHKGSMQSVVSKAVKEIKETGQVKLFKSYHPDYQDGCQRRDFIYVKDCISVMNWFLENPKSNGLFNLGTGQAKTWRELTGAVFKAMNIEENIEYIEMPAELKSHYQYFTQASMSKLRNAGYKEKFESLEDGVKDYVQNFLVEEKYLSSI
ncbi:MAG: ADP-glyceromanno-heptose 6-epimerase [bacterium]